MKAIKALLYVFSWFTITCYGTQIAIKKIPDNAFLISIKKSQDQEGSIGGIIINHNKRYIFEYGILLTYDSHTQTAFLEVNFFDEQIPEIPRIDFEISELFKSIIEQINQLFQKATNQFNTIKDEQQRIITLNRLNKEGTAFLTIEDSPLLTQLYTSVTDLVEKYIKQLPYITFFELQKITYKSKEVTKAATTVPSSTSQPTTTEAAAVPQSSQLPTVTEQKQETLPATPPSPHTPTVSSTLNPPLPASKEPDIPSVPLIPQTRINPSVPTSLSSATKIITQQPISPTSMQKKQSWYDSWLSFKNRYISLLYPSWFTKKNAALAIGGIGVGATVGYFYYKYAGYR
ncbi:MAG TPA: hypothetical protein VGW78_07125 [Candidatus Babeliales bacterium]|jgi:hypothetical protein|nr:hypothetical protein [Candidatus Babeliales bacterium]